MTEAVHQPSRYAYVKKACRCEGCTAENRRYIARWKARALGVPQAVHGLNAYNNYGCRCDECKAAKAESNALARARRKASSSLVNPPV